MSIVRFGLLIVSSAFTCSHVYADPDPSPLIVAGATAALIEMGQDVASESHGTPIICVGVRLTVNAKDPDRPTDVPSEAFKRIESALRGHADIHNASSCTITRWKVASVNNQPAWLLDYTDIDTLIDTERALSGMELPRRIPRKAYQPNREAPPFHWAWVDFMIGPDRRFMWDGVGGIATPSGHHLCGFRNYDFSGDEGTVKIETVRDDPQVCGMN